MSYKTRLLSALREKQGKEFGVHVGTIAECIKLAEEIPEDDGWISVKDRLPGAGKRVLFSDGVFVGEGYIDNDRRWNRYYTGDVKTVLGIDVTKWMLMPEPPKEKNDDITKGS